LLIKNEDLLESHQRLCTFVREAIELCAPKDVHICDGSQEEYDMLCEELVIKGVFIPLSKRPRSFLCRSDPLDVARTEESTFLCFDRQEEAGPTNLWRDPVEMLEHLRKLFSSCMQGRTLYVVPFCMGLLHSSFCLFGVEITDSPYVVCCMKHTTRMGRLVLEDRDFDQTFIPCMHSVGKPLKEGESDVTWPCNIEQRCLVHFPNARSIFAFGSGYGGNALLGKKSIALRLASWFAKKEGWLAEHMLIISVTSPENKKKYFAGAFPSHCGKTNLALLSSSCSGWSVECVGDDIAWIRKGKDGRLYAVNPESGFFGVTPGLSWTSNPHAMKMMESDTIFTNVALTQDGDVWWEGMTQEIPEGLIDWRGNLYDVASKECAAHPNARFTVDAKRCPILDAHAEDRDGVLLAGILFGGRRADVIPLVYEAFSWQHGVFLGASISSEMTSAATGKVGTLRHDPFAMLPFCGYHMGEYFAHWLDIGKECLDPPKIFCVNWFRKDQEGRFLWPGFGENIRVLAWMFMRIDNTEAAEESPIGWLPRSSFGCSELFHISLKQWKQECSELARYFTLFNDKMPREILQELNGVMQRIEQASSKYDKLSAGD